MKKIFFAILSVAVTFCHAQNVGIGIVAPQKKLHVAQGVTPQAVYLTDATMVVESNSHNYLQLMSLAGLTSGIVSGTAFTAQRSAIKFSPDSAINFHTGGNINWMSLEKNGFLFLGINVTPPASRLHVCSGSSGNSTISSSRIATFEDNVSSYIQLLNPTASESGILAGNTSTLIKSGIVFSADSAINLRTGGNNTRVIITNDGDMILANGKVTRTATGTTDLVPVCYGTILPSGTVFGGSGNFIAVKNATGEYDITITGENYVNGTYTTVVTPQSTSGRMVSTNSVAGKLRVYTFLASGADTDTQFCFVVYKH